jgi:WXG100 family type VII secretion target
VTAFAADLEALQNLVDRMTAFERALGKRLDEVDGRAIRLQASWSGVAATAYGVAHRRWLRDARGMHAALGQLRRAAATARDNYSAAVTANRGMWP